jgi:hypothetical protein
LREIARNRLGVDELTRKVLEALAPPGREHDPRTGGVEHAGEPGAEPRARSGDDCDAPVETERGQGIELRHGRECTRPVSRES